MDSGTKERKKLGMRRNRYEFQTNHGFRKWFKTRCEQSGMKSINIETLMGHSIGISRNDYYRITEEELLDEYLKAVDLLDDQRKEYSSTTGNSSFREHRRSIR